MNKAESWTWDGSYPVRCQIIDAAGEQFGQFTARTPDASRPYIGEFGIAERVEGDVRITLESGETLMGYECWWTPLEGKP